MTPWRPSSTIRVKALGLHWRDGRLLASEVNRDDGTLKGVRPLGGTVEFGETWQDALIREYQEDKCDTCIARWFDPFTLSDRGIALYPDGLLSRLSVRRARSTNSAFRQYHLRNSVPSLMDRISGRKLINYSILKLNVPKLPQT